MASSRSPNSGPYRCPEDLCGKTFHDLKDFFDKEHWDKHKSNCPMADCSSKSSKPSNFKSHWMKFPTHREYLGLAEEREDCDRCGESYTKQYKFNHNRDCTRPKSNKRSRDEAENNPRTSIPDGLPWNINESRGDTQRVMCAGFELLQSPVSRDNISGSIEPGLADHDTELEAGFFGRSQEGLDFESFENLLAHSIASNIVESRPEQSDLDFGDLTEPCHPSDQQQRCSVGPVDEVAFWTTQLNTETSILAASNLKMIDGDTMNLMFPGVTSALSNSDMLLIPFTEQHAGTNDGICQGDVRTELQNIDFDSGLFPASHVADDPELQVLALERSGGDHTSLFGQDMIGDEHPAKRPRLEGSPMMDQTQKVVSAATSTCRNSAQKPDMSLALTTQTSTLEELTKSIHRHKPVILRYRLDQQRYEPARAGSRTVFTYSQVVAVEKFAPEVSLESITVFRQWLRKVRLVKRMRSKQFSRLRIEDQRIDVDAPLVKSTRIIRMFEDDHPAFAYCKQGHWQELNRLLSTKEVTIADVNSHGQTLLHIAAQCLQSDICQQLLLKGADVTARDFSEQQQTAFGLLCHESAMEIKNNADCVSLMPETIRILLNHGHDIVVSHEIDNDLIMLFEAKSLVFVTDESRQALSRIAVAVLTSYFSSITCDGLLTDVGFHTHTEECLSFYAMECTDVDAELNAIARLTPQTSQAFFLAYIYGHREAFFWGVPDIKKLVEVIGDLHYRASFEVDDDHDGPKNITTTPLELASQNVSTWCCFQRELEAAGISWPGFIRDELKSPNCNWRPDVLQALSEIKISDYIATMETKWPKFEEWLEEQFYHDPRGLNRAFHWVKVVGDLQQGIPLTDVEHEILQSLDRFALHMSYHDEEEADSDSSDEDEDEGSESPDEGGESSDEDMEVDLWHILQHFKSRKWRCYV